MKLLLFFLIGLANFILNLNAGLTSWISSKNSGQEAIPIAEVVQPSAPPSNFINPYRNRRLPPTNPEMMNSSSTGTNQPWKQKILSIIEHNNLENFYPTSNLNQVFNRLNQIDFQVIADKWGIPIEMVYDLCSLALYDVIFYVDNSGSMKYEDRGARMNDLKVCV